MAKPLRSVRLVSKPQGPWAVVLPELAQAPQSTLRHKLQQNQVRSA
jgi:hypothetical protein